jgi:hypothetical protein
MYATSAPESQQPLNRGYSRTTSTLSGKKMTPYYLLSYGSLLLVLLSTLRSSVFEMIALVADVKTSAVERERVVWYHWYQSRNY